MAPKTFISKNYDSGLLHAYRNSGSHFQRRCGSSGRGEFISGEEELTEVSARWFVQQSDACRKCVETFELERDTDSKPTEDLQRIAANYSDGRSTPSKKNGAEADSSTPQATDKGEIVCPVTFCDYSDSIASVAAHVSGKRDDDHDWEELGFEGAHDFKHKVRKG